jgi:hypothetical protein
MNRHQVQISNGGDTLVKISIRAGATGFEVHTTTTIGGRSSHNEIAAALGDRRHAVQAAGIEASRIAAALLAGVAP